MEYLTKWSARKLIEEIAFEENLKDLRTNFEGDVRLRIERLFDEGNETGQLIKGLAENYDMPWGCNRHAINLTIYEAIGFERIKAKYIRSLRVRVNTEIKTFLKSKISLSVCNDVNYLISEEVLNETTNRLATKVAPDLWKKWKIDNTINDIAYSYARAVIKKSLN